MIQADALILTQPGKRIRLNQLKAGNNVYSYDDCVGAVSAVTAATISDPVKLVVKDPAKQIRHQLIVSAETSIFGAAGWTRAGSLKEGTEVGIRMKDDKAVTLLPIDKLEKCQAVAGCSVALDEPLGLVINSYIVRAVTI